MQFILKKIVVTAQFMVLPHAWLCVLIRRQGGEGRAGRRRRQGSTPSLRLQLEHCYFDLTPWLKAEEVKPNNARGESTPGGNHLTGPMGDQSSVWSGQQGAQRGEESQVNRRDWGCLREQGAFKRKGGNTWWIEEIKILVQRKNTENFFF